jgi:hypothetical protein
MQNGQWPASCRRQLSCELNQPQPHQIIPRIEAQFTDDFLMAIELHPKSRHLLGQEVNMADKASYPQIPATVWWGVRNILQRTPNTTLDERNLGIQLNVQETAARQYVTELKRVGILSEENKATLLAQRWRNDETYADAVDEILRDVYPESLTDIAPRGAADRQKIVSWFLREGLGSGSAGNKAATYLLLSSASPNEAPTRGNVTPQKSPLPKTIASKKTRPILPSGPVAKTNEGPAPSAATGKIPLNINVQIHISAEASSEQIESIFASMRRYLYDTVNT